MTDFRHCRYLHPAHGEAPAARRLVGRAHHGRLALITFAMLLRYFTGLPVCLDRKILHLFEVVLAMVGGSSAARDSTFALIFQRQQQRQRRRLARLGALMTALCCSGRAGVPGLGRLALRRNLARHWRAAVGGIRCGCHARWPYLACARLVRARTPSSGLCP